ncbi:MAG TPA: hypothetical protein VJX67_12825 [Blastocatellia bacterium]|nr:hypothetical protein [Blastocatellia bacterium]
MQDSDVKQEAAFDLIDLIREVDELEAGRADLVRRIDEARLRMVSAGRATATIRAAAEMLRDHLASNAETAANIRAIRREMQEEGQTVTEVNSQTLGLLFEADGLTDSLGEAEEEMERLLEILAEGKLRDPRGH